MKLSLEWHFTPRDLAEAFCELTSDGQARFFVDVAKIVEEWDDVCVGGAGSIMQMHDVGRRLKGEIGARSLLNDIVDAADEVGPGDLLGAIKPKCPYCGGASPYCANCSEELP